MLMLDQTLFFVQTAMLTLLHHLLCSPRRWRGEFLSELARQLNINLEVETFVQRQKVLDEEDATRPDRSRG